MKCKNIECENEIEGKKVYCSLSCRSYYVNKYHRSYDKMHNTRKEKLNKTIEKYNLNPNKCECGNIIKYKDKKNKFCGKECFKKNLSINNPVYNFTKEHKEIIGKKIADGLEKYNKSIGKTTRRDNRICKYCKKEYFPYGLRFNRLFCSNDCKKLNRRQKSSKYRCYKLDSIFHFDLKTYPNEFNFDLIRKYGWYSPTNKRNNLEGVSRDHMFSIRNGFDYGINSKIIAHPANCELIRQKDNSTKHSKNSITIDELIEKIRKWDSKYGYFYGYDIIKELNFPVV